MPDSVAMLAALQKEPWRYDFFSALRLIERAYPQMPPLGTSMRLRDDPVRLAQHVSLSFEPTMIKRLNIIPDAPARLEVTFFGLLGPNAPMPLYLSEEALANKVNQQDCSMGHFLDIFHHRLLSLLFRAWSKGGTGPCLESYLRAFTSTFHSAEEKNGEHCFGRFFVEQRRNAQGLCRLLQHAFGLPAQIQPFRRNWMTLSEADVTLLGRSRLNPGVTLGKRVYGLQNYVEIVLRPIDFAAYQRCLPGQEQFSAMIKLIRRYMGDAIQWSITLTLCPSLRPPLQLSGSATLGHSTWLGPGKSESQQDCLITPTRYYI